MPKPKIDATGSADPEAARRERAYAMKEGEGNEDEDFSFARRALAGSFPACRRTDPHGRCGERPRRTRPNG